MILEEVMEELLEEHGYDIDDIESVIDWTRRRKADEPTERRQPPGPRPRPKAKDRVFDRKGQRPEEYYKDQLFELEAKGELIVHRIDDEAQQPVEIETKFGRKKKVPVDNTWHHKSCGQCGHIPGYSTSIFWLQRELGYTYHDPRDQTSCTAWNYYASSTSNPAAQAAVAAAQLRPGLRGRLLPDHPLRHQLRPLQGGARGADPPPRSSAIR